MLLIVTQRLSIDLRLTPPGNSGTLPTALRQYKVVSMQKDKLAQIEDGRLKLTLTFSYFIHTLLVNSAHVEV